MSHKGEITFATRKLKRLKEEFPFAFCASLWLTSLESLP